jgi:tRNA(fMet)-specific endonuclease VapC
MIADTTLFVDADRGRLVAIRLMHEIGDALATTWITIGELRAGATTAVADHVIATIPVYGIDDEVARKFGDIRRYLRETGQMIGHNDLWIAAIALSQQQPVLTRNGREFSRVPGLTVVLY